MAESPSLLKIAEACGVSAATVSRALRDSKKLPEETRRRIRKTAEKMGYVPNRSVSQVMRGIRLRRKVEYRETIGYIAPDPHVYEQVIYQGVTRRAKELGYAIDRFVLQDVAADGPVLRRMLLARGIRGLIVAPFGYANARLDLDWERLAAVAIGYSMIEPDIHRVERDCPHMMRLMFLRLKARGYRRIGFIFRRSQEERMQFTMWGSCLVYQSELPEDQVVKPLISDGLTADMIIKWYEATRPDVVVTMDHPTKIWLRRAGYRVPEDVGFLDLACPETELMDSGIIPDYGNVGAAALEQVGGLVDRGEFGVPPSPKCLQVPGVWREGTTIRSLPEKASRPAVSSP